MSIFGLNLDLFYCFYLLVVFPIPLYLLLSGLCYLFFPYKKINNIIGYRSTRSKSHSSAWLFAQRHSGAYRIIFGSLMLFIMIVISLFLFKASSDVLENAYKIIIFIEIILGNLVQVPTELALRRKFNLFSNKKN